jgi:hypothetical protein
LLRTEELLYFAETNTLVVRDQEGEDIPNEKLVEFLLKDSFLRGGSASPLQVYAAFFALKSQGYVVLRKHSGSATRSTLADCVFDVYFGRKGFRVSNPGPPNFGLVVTPSPPSPPMLSSCLCKFDEHMLNYIFCFQ